MAKKKLFGKVLDLIGLEETTLDEEMDRDYDDDGYDIYDSEPEYDDYDDYSDDYTDDYDDYEEEEEVRPSFGRSSSRRKEKKEKFRSSSRDREFERDSDRDRDFGQESKVVGLTPNRMKMVVYQPMTYDDTQNIIDNLKNRKPIIVNLETLDVDIAQRILDFMSGAVYALNGNIHKVSKGIFLLVPNNVDIAGNIPDELQGKSFYTLGSKRREL